ncbi:MAG: HGGxSTG domain-containing protein [Rhodospirillaceae bacterium]|jgi:hypothetical protein
MSTESHPRRSHERPTHCGARTRGGTPCKLPPVTDRTRCRMHGGSKTGAKPSGAQVGNQNAFLHGYYSAAARAERKRLADQIRWLKAQMKAIRESS